MVRSVPPVMSFILFSSTRSSSNVTSPSVCYWFTFYLSIILLQYMFFRTIILFSSSILIVLPFRVESHQSLPRDSSTVNYLRICLLPSFLIFSSLPRQLICRSCFQDSNPPTLLLVRPVTPTLWHSFPPFHILDSGLSFPRPRSRTSSMIRSHSWDLK